MTQHARQILPASTDEYVTIIAPSLGAVMGQFRARGLGQRGFTITGPVARHQFAYAGEGGVEGPCEMFGGVAMVAATFRRGATSH